MPISTVLSLVLLLTAAAFCSPLSVLYERAMERQDSVLHDKLAQLLKSSVPSGIDASNPKIAEYETFKQSPDANFIHDGNGKLHFRQYRRINLNAAMARRAGI